MKDYSELTEDELSKIILDICFRMHKKLGPGLLESVYEEIFCYELRKMGLKFERQKSIPVIWEEVKMSIGFRSDVIVENKVMVELKSSQTITPTFKKTLLTYIRLTDIKLGLLINFNEALLKDGLARVVNNL